jgi:hypothetical protein
MNVPERPPMPPVWYLGGTEPPQDAAEQDRWTDDHLTVWVFIDGRWVNTLNPDDRRDTA